MMDAPLPRSVPGGTGLHEAADLWRARNPSRIYQPTTAIHGTTQLRRTSPRNPHSRGGTTGIDLVWNGHAGRRARL